MKHLHVLINDKFTDPYIKFINKHFNQNEHLFLILGKGKGAKIVYSNNVFQSSRAISSIRQLLKEVHSSEKIHLHGLFFWQMVVLLFFQPWLLKKCNWVVWGGDLYCYRQERKTLKEKVKEALRRVVIRNIGHITTLVRGDYELALEWYGTKAKYHHGVYINPISLDYLDRLPTSNKTDTDTINIQVGNSGDPSNQHIEVLRSLKKFNEKVIRIYLPLSYGGSKEYIGEVIEYGHKIFGNKFVPLLEFLKADEYAKYLSSIDVAIFNHNRQQGLFNIVSLMYLDKKVYIRSDITSWEYFSSDLDANIYNTLDLDKISFYDFKINDKNQNTVKVKKLFQDQYLVGIWKNIFEEVSE